MTDGPKGMFDWRRPTLLWVAIRMMLVIHCSERYSWIQAIQELGVCSFENCEENSKHRQRLPRRRRLPKTSIETLQAPQHRQPPHHRHPPNPWMIATTLRRLHFRMAPPTSRGPHVPHNDPLRVHTVTPDPEVSLSMINSHGENGLVSM